ncbi:oxidoreductase-like domain-containing protein [Pseudoalteromonas holothuriae]|uniref:oxidoreductase-like domain-containing protein n=1 Tax=Pseudoalteromonas holothuriae TaxID=2963714 RepID=UPI0021C10131|nr:oxidoreductase-like domain-containing protein [Pseudoalteromonas sp. CIP111854]
MSNSTKNPPCEPKKPKSDECCAGGSCCPCVWDTYRAQKRQWLKYQQTSIALNKKQSTSVH